MVKMNKEDLQKELHDAFYEGDFEQAKKIIKKGASFDYFYETTLMLCRDYLINPPFKDLAFILNNLKDINLKDKQGYTLLDKLIMLDADFLCIHETVIRGGRLGGNRNLFMFLAANGERGLILLKMLMDATWQNRQHYLTENEREIEDAIERDNE